MSGAGFVSPGALLVGITSLVSIQASAPNRQMGGIVADCTIEEEGTDDLTITEHPVEQGASITDHAFKQPARLVLRVGWSNSSLSAGFDPNYVTDIYNKLLALQVSAKVFTVTTGKRQYDNMLMKSLRLRTDEETETALDVVVQFQQIIIVQTSSTSVPATGDQALPQQTAPTQNLGTQQLAPAVIPSLGIGTGP